MRSQIFQYAIRSGFGLLLAGCLVGFNLPGAAAPPFAVNRTHESVTVRGSVPLSYVMSGPFDDADGLLSDGQPHYYVATVAGGGPLTLSVQKNLHRDTIRIGFDDEDPQSAQVDPSLSSIVAAPDTVPADGVSTVVATIVPRDADGVALGTGLALRLDGGALWPAFPVGTIEDNGDGSYTIRVASSIPTTSTLSVEVEGIALDDPPLLTFEDTGAWDLREQALLRLEDLATSNGLFDKLLEGLAPGSDAAKQIEIALEATEKTLDELYDWKDKDAVSGELKKAVDELEKVFEKPGTVDLSALQVLIDHLVDAARLLAVHHIAEAEATCGVCGQGGPDKICEAREALQDGDTKRQSPDPKFQEVVDDYGKAVDEALAACS